ncbi:MAG TPA: GNAT family N-acetyltransferase [Anaerolineales bacterium]|nr:GNAT family N-acetyltransferase [Anaerolineales bacterium]HNN13920.1 GNAT family N-acetyltransferase [Anaerolineales bacterium]HNO32070.1 GNAT family N-acetyltransferase [Anaerolineales bacterium]
MSNDLILVREAPAIPGLKFRHFRGEVDYPAMLKAIAASADADKIERADTIENLANGYAHLTNCDPYHDMIFAEVNDEVIGYSRGWWYQEQNDGPYLYGFVGFLVPAWRRKGIGQTVLQWVENRMREVAAIHHPPEKEKFFQAFTTQYEAGVAAMLQKNGYQPIRYFHEMVRPTLDNIPDFPLPEGLEVRPVQPDHYRKIWDASNEAFRDHWGFSEPTEEDYQAWLGDKSIFQPQLWQVVWDVASDQIAGQVRTFIDHGQNAKFNRKRGYTEFISVGRPWRKRGVARALIIRSLLVQKEQGMTQSALGVDSENPSGATRVYEDCGFQVVKKNTIYRKPL